MDDKKNKNSKDNKKIYENAIRERERAKKRLYEEKRKQELEKLSTEREALKQFKKSIKITEYSKRVLMIITILWLMVALWGCILVTLQFVWYSVLDLSYILTYVGAPMGGGLVAYLIKSALENKQKIKNLVAGLLPDTYKMYYGDEKEERERDDRPQHDYFSDEPSGYDYSGSNDYGNVGGGDMSGMNDDNVFRNE